MGFLSGGSSFLRDKNVLLVWVLLVAGPERFPASFRPRCRIHCTMRSLAQQDDPL